MKKSLNTSLVGIIWDADYWVLRIFGLQAIISKVDADSEAISTVSQKACVENNSERWRSTKRSRVPACCRCMNVLGGKEFNTTGTWFCVVHGSFREK